MGLTPLGETACKNCDDKPLCARQSNKMLKAQCKNDAFSRFCPSMCGLARCGGQGFVEIPFHEPDNNAPSLGVYLKGVGEGLKAWMVAGGRVLSQLEGEVDTMTVNGDPEAENARESLKQVKRVWSNQKAGLEKTLKANKESVGLLCNNGEPTSCNPDGTEDISGYRKAVGDLSGCKCSCKAGYEGVNCGVKKACSIQNDCSGSINTFKVTGNCVDGCKCQCNAGFGGPKCQQHLCQDKLPLMCKALTQFSACKTDFVNFCQGTCGLC
jgi:hypothetical protein